MSNNYTIAIDQSTSATKAMLFNSDCKMLFRSTIPHEQIYPQAGWVEHNAEEIYQNTLLAVKNVLAVGILQANDHFSVAITNQRETVVVWNRETGKPAYNAVVWQCQRGAEICKTLVDNGFNDIFKQKTGLLIDPYFSASGIRWILDNVENARALAIDGKLLAGTIDSWLLWKLTAGKVHATDYTNASRTLLFNIHTLNWDDELLQIFDIPRNMLPAVKPCDTIFGESNFEGILDKSVSIAGIIGDSHGALAGQMCFAKGMGKATYGTGSSLMVNIGETPAKAPEGLVTSVGFAAFGKVFYAYEGNVHCTGATIKWLKEELQIIENEKETEAIALSISDNGGVYFVPAFAGLGAPWWNPNAKAAISGMTLGTGKAHVVRAAIEAIAYQIKDLCDLIQQQSGVSLKELRVDGGPTKNGFLMQFQSDMLDTPINVSEIEEASALGAVLMNGLALGKWQNFTDIEQLRTKNNIVYPKMENNIRKQLYNGWIKALNQLKVETPPQAPPKEGM
jgi:Glycerol kinase